MFIRFTTTEHKAKVIALNTSNIARLELAEAIVDGAPSATRVFTTDGYVYRVRGTLNENVDRINWKLTEGN